MYKKILVCLDGSQCSMRAAQAATAMAARLGSEVIALNVFEPIYADAFAMPAWSIPIGQETFDRAATTRKRSIEKSVRPIFEQGSVDCRVIQAVGDPVDCIVGAAEREAVDLIVTGRRGLLGFTEFVLGSTSNAVLHRAHCPVLIARGENAPHVAGEFSRILLASCGSSTSDKATETAVHLAEKFESRLDVLNVFDSRTPWFVRHRDASDIEEAIGRFDSEEYARRCMERIKQKTLAWATEAHVTCSFHQESGAVGQSVVRYAGEHGTDLIVVGSRSLGGFREMLLGSTSSYVAHRSGSAVLVVR